MTTLDPRPLLERLDGETDATVDTISSISHSSIIKGE